MILADTSVWIELLHNPLAYRRSGAEVQSLVTCPPVVQEVLQGLRPGQTAPAESFLAAPVLADPLPLPLFRAAAGIFREGRAHGFTIRSSIDCLIAAIAIAYDVPVWHRDRDFDAIAKFTDLRIARP